MHIILSCSALTLTRLLQWIYLLAPHTLRRTYRKLTECILTYYQLLASIHFPLRNAMPEHPVRVANQVFSAFPRAPFLREMLKVSLVNLGTMKVDCDYAVLLCGANAALDKLFHRTQFRDYELLSFEKSREVSPKISSRGS